MENLNFKKGIEALLKYHKLNVADLIERSKLSEDIINPILDEVMSPSKEIIKAIASAFNVNVEVLLFLSLDRENVPEDRREMFDTLNPTLTELILKLSEES